MTVNVTIPVYQRKRENTLEWTTLGLGAHTLSRSANSAHRIEQALVDSLRKNFEGLPPRDLVAFALKRGTRLVRVRLEVSLKGETRRKVSGLFPFIVEPHTASERVPFVIAYHPARQADWFPVRDEEVFEEQARAFLGHILGDIDDGGIEALLSDGRDSIRVLSFSATARSALDLLAKKQKGIWDDLKVDPTREAKPQPGALKVLPKIGTDWTRGFATSEPPGAPRSPYREQLQALLGLTAKRPTIVVGEPGVGKTTLLRRWIADQPFQGAA